MSTANSLYITMPWLVVYANGQGKPVSMQRYSKRAEADEEIRSRLACTGLPGWVCKDVHGFYEASYRKHGVRLIR